MKALDFLVNLKQSRDFDGNLESSLDESIAELEEMQQSRSCDGCKHYKFTYNSNDGAVRQLMTICSDCFRRLNRDNYEPKE